MYSNKLPLEPRHLGVSSGASKMISKPMVHSAQTVHLYCISTNSFSKQTEKRFHTTHSPRSSIECVQHDFRADGTFDTNCAPFLRQDYHYLQTDSNKVPLEPHLQGAASGVSKTNSEPMVRSVQTLHLYCTDSNTVSKQTLTRFNVIHSPRSCIGCVQDDFRADGTLNTNYAPILRQE
jgi:hypothetical protein